MEIVVGILKESFYLLKEMAPYLIIGYIFAGLLKMLISQDKIIKYLGNGKIASSVNASIIGIPLPICSCGVIPTAIALRRQGANIGATLSFLISTPTTGIDSILATYSLLGPIFTFFRVVLSFFAAVICGIAANFFIKEKKVTHTNLSTSNCGDSCCTSCSTISSTPSYSKKIKNAFHYGLVELIEDTGKWIIIGIIIGGAISYLVPTTLVEKYLGDNVLSMFLMLIIGIPIYVCATGSIPIAAALMLKGMSPGAALVFLIAGPATNSVTITVLGRELGKKTIILYLTLISITAILGGFILNSIWPHDVMRNFIETDSNTIPEWIKITTSILLTVLVLNGFLNKFKKKNGLCNS